MNYLRIPDNINHFNQFWICIPSQVTMHNSFSPYFNIPFKRKSTSKFVNMQVRNSNTLFNSIYFSSATLSRASVIEFRRSETICSVGCCWSLLQSYETCKTKVLEDVSVKDFTKELIPPPFHLCYLNFSFKKNSTCSTYIPFFSFAEGRFKILLT